MNAGQAVREALIVALTGHAEFAGVDGVRFPTSANVLPRVSVEVPQATDWSTKGARGRELRTAISMRVAAGQVARLPAMMAVAETVGEALTGTLSGWQVASAVLIGARSFDGGNGSRAALVEHRVRVLEN